MPRLFLRISPSQGFLHLDRNGKKRLLKILRLRTGDSLEVFTPGKRWECRISKILQDGVQLSIVRELPVPPSPRIHLVLAQAIPKGERFDWLIQKATELGVAEIIPLVTEYSVVRPANPDAKLQRWNEIAEHAAGQSENAFPVLIHPPESLTDFLKRNIEGTKLLLLEREKSEPLRKILQVNLSNSITFVVGPEGGWTSEETSLILAAGFCRVHLGPRILRAETAGLALAAILQYELGDFAE